MKHNRLPFPLSLADECPNAPSLVHTHVVQIMYNKIDEFALVLCGADGTPQYYTPRGLP